MGKLLKAFRTFWHHAGNKKVNLDVLFNQNGLPALKCALLSLHLYVSTSLTS